MNKSIKRITCINEGENKVKEIENFAKQNKQNLFHLTIHPKEECTPENLFSKTKSFLRKNIFSESLSDTKNDFCYFLSFVEYGKQITDLNYGQITRTGIHIHVLFTTSKSIKETSKLFETHKKTLKWEFEHKITPLQEIYRYNYWVKQLPILKSVYYQDNFSSKKNWTKKRSNIESTLDLFNII